MSELTTRYQYFDFEQYESPGKTGRWKCTTKRGACLGIVKWYGAWRQYCYFPYKEAVYSAGCLMDIADFLNKANKVSRMEQEGLTDADV